MVSSWSPESNSSIEIENNLEIPFNDSKYPDSGASSIYVPTLSPNNQNTVFIDFCQLMQTKVDINQRYSSTRVKLKQRELIGFGESVEDVVAAEHLYYRF